MSTKKLQIIGNLVKVDETLTQEGRAADAKATGDAINQLQTSIDEVAGLVGDLNGEYYTETEIDSMIAALNAVIDSKSDVDHIHDDLYYTETEIDDRFDAMQSDIDSKVDVVEGMGLSTNDYTTAEKDKLATIETNANFYEHPTYTSYTSGLYKVIIDDSGHVSGATLAAKEDIVALGIPEQDTTYDTDISDLNDRIDEVEDSITTTNETLSGVSQELENYKITNNEAVSTNADGIEANKTAIEAIQGDYLTSADKTQLQDQITKVSDKATANASAIEVLNGEGDGSVKQSINNAFNEFAANVSNDDVVNTYKELIDYAAKHGPEFTELVGKVDTINTHVGEIETNFANYKTEVSEQFTETDTIVNNHVTNTNNPHGVTKDQIGLDQVDNTPDLDKPISRAVDEALQGKADLEHAHEIGEIDSLQDLLDGLQSDIDTNATNINKKADLEHEHNDLYYTKDEILDSITVEDIDAICEFQSSDEGGDLVNVATEEWVQTHYQPKGNYTRQTEFSEHNTSSNAHTDIRNQISQLSSDKADKTGLTLGVHTDGYVYLFVNGSPQGNGLDIKTDIIEGDVFGYVDENNVVVLNGALADGTYTIKYEMEDGSIINIGNLVLDSTVYYSITNTLTKCTSNNSAKQVAQGNSYSATITANSGYAMSSIKVTMGGTDITSTAVSGNKITVASVTGNIVITAVATEVQTAEPTNFFNSSETPAVYGRIGSDGTNRTDASTSFATNYIPVQTGDVVIVDGCDIGGIISGTGTYYMACYDGSKAKLFAGQSDASNAYFIRDSYTTRTAQITVTGNDVAYLRFTCSYPGNSAKEVEVNDITINIKRNGEYL